MWYRIISYKGDLRPASTHLSSASIAERYFPKAEGDFTF
jgi:hypothetical protein